MTAEERHLDEARAALAGNLGPVVTELVEELIQAKVDAILAARDRDPDY